MTAMLTAESRGNTGDTKDIKVQMCIEECRRMKIPVLGPDINRSAVEFAIEGRSIRFGLSAIKNVGAAAIESILSAREKDGAFRGLADFAQRVDLQKVNRKVLESLIKTGAMDGFGKRAAMLSGLDRLIAESHRAAKQASCGQTGLFDGERETQATLAWKLPEMEETPREELLRYEREYLGFYLTEHPAQKALDKLMDMITHEVNELGEEKFLGKTVTTGGIVAAARRVFTKKNNEEMAFLTLRGRDGALIECVVFPKIYSDGGKEACQIDGVVVCSGRVDHREERLSLVVDSIRKIR
jgi:DNA polymerase-3 subunit alpha